VATGTPTLTYQWQFLSGATWHNFAIGTGFNTATFTFPAATAFANGEQIRVVVTDGNGLSTTSNAVTLTVSDAAPVITVQPTNQTTTLGNTATFSVTATGNLPLTYAWQFLSGATWHNFAIGTGFNTATFTFPAATAFANGEQIRVVVTDGNGLSTTSNTVTLTVN
jgi:predicted acyl esterase